MLYHRSNMIDVHLHLQDARLSAGVEVIVDQCQEEGVGRLVVNGTCPRDWPRVEELAQRFPHVVRPAYGLHPWCVQDTGPGWHADLASYLERGAIGIGEIGLDRWVRGYDLLAQKEAFVWQLRLAVERDLPVSIHCLRAWGHLLEILRVEALPSSGFLLHSYGGPAEMVGELAQLGAYFSVSGYFFHERKRAALETFLGSVPRERLLLETDAPDMGLPQEMMRYRFEEANHPANLKVIYEHMAWLLGMTPETFAAEIHDNARRLFGSSL